MKRGVACLGVFILVLLTGQVACGAENLLAYRPLSAPDSDHARKTNLLTRWFLLSLSFYSDTMSTVDGDRCPSFPSCSRYAQAALRRHGVIPGMWLAVDRLIHEHTEIERRDRIRLQDGALRIPDTLDANDFWLFNHHFGNP
ncbi:MAG: membrane protein insertion efficiency factor YidD [Magnetococcus sp. DMHC-1]